MPELLFLFCYFFCVPVLSRLQYNGRFEQASLMSIFLGYTFVSSLMSFLPKLFFYFVITPFLFKKSYLHFAVYTLLYLLFNDFYLRYAVDLFLSELRFLPREIWETSLNAYHHSKTLIIRQSITLTSLNLVVLIGLAYFVHSVKKEKEIAMLRKQRMMAELDYLKAQINPSFFFDTLGNIHALALKGSPQTAGFVARLSEIMRYVLYQPESRVPLGKELEFITNYIAAEQSRLDKKLAVSFDVQGKTNGLLIEPLLLIPFIEQALESVTRQQASTEIVILISGNDLTMEIKSDDLLSAAPENIIQRLNLLYYGKYILQSGDHEFSLNLELCHEH